MNELETKDVKYCCYSKEVEERTHAYNKYFMRFIIFIIVVIFSFIGWGIYGVIDISTGSNIAHVMGKDFYLIYTMLIGMFFFIAVFGIHFFLYLLSYMYVYKWEGNTLTKAVRAGGTRFDGNKYFSDYEHMEKYFDTYAYGKAKVYHNVKLVKETMYTLIYTSDEKRRIRIPKVYIGMEGTKRRPQRSLRYRMGVLTCLLSVGYLFIGGCYAGYVISHEDKYRTIETELIESVDKTLQPYGFIQQISVEEYFENEAPPINWSRSNPISKEEEILQYSMVGDGICISEGKLFFSFAGENNENDLLKKQEEINSILNTVDNTLLMKQSGKDEINKQFCNMIQKQGVLSWQMRTKLIDSSSKYLVIHMYTSNKYDGVFVEFDLQTK